MNKTRERFTKWRDSDFKERFNKLSFVGFAPSMDKASLFAWMGYQQAVKDHKAEIEAKDKEIVELTRQRDELKAAVNKISNLSRGSMDGLIHDLWYISKEALSTNEAIQSKGGSDET